MRAYLRWTNHEMKKSLILLVANFILTFHLPMHSQKTVIYVIGEDSKTDTCLSKILDRHNLVFENRGLDIMIDENYETMDS